MLALGLEILTKRSQPAERGIEWIERAATAGQSSAARTLAKVYAQGIGVAVDRSKAKAWSREALASGDSAARPILINLLLGDGDDASLREAAALLEVIAATGSVSALLTLGDLHGLGERGPWTNPLRALEAWRLAADGGSSKAMMRLGWAFETGQLGLTPKTETALDWYRGAAANGHEPAKASLARLELERG
jgi:hypothetical protein